MYYTECNEYIPSGVNLNACPSCGVDLNLVVATATKRPKEGQVPNQTTDAEGGKCKNFGAIKMRGMVKGANPSPSDGVRYSVFLANAEIQWYILRIESGE